MPARRLCDLNWGSRSTAEQMLDAYSSAGMPLFYKHWSFGKHFAHREAFYRKGIMGLAYEIVINTHAAKAH